MEKKKILVIDGLNALFLRSYIVDPTLSSNGQPIGGISGSLKILQKMCREIKPSRIIICWDGKGGSTKRRSLNNNYKEGRKPIKLNRNIKNLSENEEIDNKIWQMTRLAEYLNEMPIIQLLSDGVEADDLISAIVQHPAFKEDNKIIVSSDKDFIQLCDDSTVLYRPVQQEILNKKRIVEEYGIHPRNFCLARAIAGDKSDNLDGVGGVGISTIAKRFPILAEEKDYTLDDILKICKETDSEIKAYSNIIEHADRVRENYKIMQLAIPQISVQDSQKINYSLKNSEKTFNKTGILKLQIQDGLAAIDWTELFLRMKMIQSENC